MTEIQNVSLEIGGYTKLTKLMSTSMASAFHVAKMFWDSLEIFYGTSTSVLSVTQDLVYEKNCLQLYAPCLK